MSEIPQIRLRLVLTAALLAAGILTLDAVSRQERIPPRKPFDAFPATFGQWTAKNQPLEPRIVQAVGVDDYLNRLYSAPGELPVQLYVGYYQSQRTGDTIHSPKNCLPGGGWEPIRASRVQLELRPGSQVTVNEYVIKKGLDEDLVLYWFQSQGRVIASEYMEKMWMVVDSLQRNRTDGALVRIWTPIQGSEKEALARASAFARSIAPPLSEFVTD